MKEVFSSLNVPIEWEEYNVSGETHGSEKLFNVGTRDVSSAIYAALTGPLLFAGSHGQLAPQQGRSQGFNVHAH